MKIGPTAPKPRTTSLGDYRPGPPLTIDDRGCVRSILDAPDSDQAWLALVDRAPVGGAYLAARLVACTSRVQDALQAIETALQHVGARRREKPGEPLPPAWLERLGDLYAERYDSLISLDDAAHAAALASPRWVATLPCVHGDDRPIPEGEVSWARLARLYERALEGLTTLTSPDAAWDALGGMDPGVEPGDGEAGATRARGRELVKAAAMAVFAREGTR